MSDPSCLVRCEFLSLELSSQLLDLLIIYVSAICINCRSCAQYLVLIMSCVHENKIDCPRDLLFIRDQPWDNTHPFSIGFSCKKIAKISRRFALLVIYCMKSSHQYFEQGIQNASDFCMLYCIINLCCSLSCLGSLSTKVTISGLFKQTCNPFIIITIVLYQK